MNKSSSFQLLPGQSRSSLTIAALVIIYTVGVLGILLEIHDQFLLLTPLNLLVSLAAALYFHPKWSTATVILLIGCYTVGFLAELYGVQTGHLFGQYVYGPVLGWKFFDTPLMIGVNWALLVYCIGTTVNRFFANAGWLWKVLIGACMMVGLDYLIEPVAITYDFWSWEGDFVPLQNYIGWFVVSLVLFACFFRIEPKATNNVALALLILQFAFFGILGLST